MTGKLKEAYKVVGCFSLYFPLSAIQHPEERRFIDAAKKSLNCIQGKANNQHLAYVLVNILYADEKGNISYSRFPVHNLIKAQT